MSADHSIKIAYKKFPIENLINNKKVINIHFLNNIENSAIYNKVLTVDSYGDVLSEFNNNQYVNFLYKISDDEIFNVVYYKEKRELMINVFPLKKYNLYSNSKVLNYSRLIDYFKELIMDESTVLKIEISSNFI